MWEIRVGFLCHYAPLTKIIDGPLKIYTQNCEMRLMYVAEQEEHVPSKLLVQ